MCVCADGKSLRRHIHLPFGVCNCMCSSQRSALTRDLCTSDNAVCLCVCACVREQTVRSQDLASIFRYCSCNCMCQMAWLCSALTSDLFISDNTLCVYMCVRVQVVRSQDLGSIFHCCLCNCMCGEWLGGAQLRQKLTNDCAHVMKCDGAGLLQHPARKFPLALTH